MDIKEEFILGLQKVTGQINLEPVGLHEPLFCGQELTYLKNCIDTAWVSSVGQYVNEFELKLSEFTGATFVIAVVNGTAALHMSLLLANVQAGDEVIVPALSFVATANAVSHCGAIPHFVEVDENTLGLDPDYLEAYLTEVTESCLDGLVNKKTGRKIKAIVPMHTFGHPLAIDKILDLSKKFKLMIVEDAAESLGSFYQGKHTGTFGDLGILSFNGNKIMTTGGGGAILTNHPELAKRARHLTTTAKLAHPWAFNHDEIAYNYRLPNLNAALGCAQLEQISEFIAAKRNLAKRYQKVFSGSQYFDVVDEPKDSQSNFWLNTLKLKEPNLALRNSLIELAIENHLHCRPTWTMLNKLPMYVSHPCSSLEVSAKLEASLICCPSSVKIGKFNTDEY